MANLGPSGSSPVRARRHPRGPAAQPRASDPGQLSSGQSCIDVARSPAWGASSGPLLLRGGGLSGELGSVSSKVLLVGELSETLDELCQRLGLPRQGAHLREALTHPSYANEEGTSVNNQRLELLGDAVLDWCVTELLFRRFPKANEGILTRLRSQLVNTQALATWARSERLAGALLLGRGAEAGGLRESDNVLADLVEAIIAAVYLDEGAQRAHEFCARLVATPLAAMSESDGVDPKTELQQRVQAGGGAAPTYELVASGGPAHACWFRVRVRVGEARGAEGTGRSKRAAEREAARLTLLDDGWRPLLVDVATHD